MCEKSKRCTKCKEPDDYEGFSCIQCERWFCEGCRKGHHSHADLLIEGDLCTDCEQQVADEINDYHESRCRAYREARGHFYLNTY